MKIKCLLVNPWIYDFAAYNFWARPLGLLKLAEFLTQFDTELFFIDCCDSFRKKKFGTGKYNYQIIEKPEILRNIPRKYKRYGISTDEFIEKIREIRTIDIIFVTSIMSYWYPAVKEVVMLLKECFKTIPLILGGIYATLYKEHAEKNIDADYIYCGQLNDDLIDVLEGFGLKLKKIREKSKYWWQLGFYKEMHYAPLLTSTGCIFRCPYCASYLLNKDYSQKQSDEVIEEILGLYSLGVKNYAFYDDALLFKADTHIKPILKRIIESSLKIKFHTPNGLHARFIDEEIAYLMKESGFKTIRLSLETVDIKRQIETGGKVTNEELEKAVFFLKKAGFNSQQIGVYLMYGLPEQTLEEVREGVDFLKKLKVRIHLTEFSPIKGTHYWNELVKKGIISDDLDPIFTNNTIFSELYAKYSKEEIEALKLDVNNYNLLI